jgi:hypothetical protein
VVIQIRGEEIKVTEMHKAISDSTSGIASIAAALASIQDQVFFSPSVPKGLFCILLSLPTYFFISLNSGMFFFVFLVCVSEDGDQQLRCARPLE